MNSRLHCLDLSAGASESCKRVEGVDGRLDLEAIPCHGPNLKLIEIGLERIINIYRIECRPVCGCHHEK